ncbi:MAG: helix-turn-helix transcriptional regulator [Rhodocyclaceae bacterium]|nr:helix-turn-helix transcriptional regulator [Rhodocyclaceae bacterium]
MPTAIRDTAYAPLIRAYFDQLKPQIEDDIVSLTRRLIEKMLATGRCSREFIADCLHLHPRTLQRRLSDEGVTFNQLLDDYRKSLALDLVSHGNASLTQVADTLGYADQSSFHQAFRRWTKTTPMKFRNSAVMA